MRALTANCMEGVDTGFEKKLEIKFIRIKDIDDPDKLLEKLFDLYKYVLVRPDLYVYGGSNENDFSEMIESIDKSFELI